MVYPLFQTSRYGADTIEVMQKVFDEVCAELGLHDREDRLRDMIAYEIMECVSKGERDAGHIRGCARKALQMPQPRAS
jgi:hypothetical protein